MTNTIFKAVDLVELESAERIDIQSESKSIMEQIEKATLDAQRIKADALRDAEKIKVQARSEAELKGFEHGRAQGFESGMEEVRELADRLKTAVDEAENYRKSMLDKSRLEVADLALDIAEKVIKTSSENQRDIVIKNIEYALSYLSEKSPVEIHVNLKDVEIAKDRIAELLNMFDKVQSIKVVADQSVERGGCVIESDMGGIDANITTQLESIRSMLNE